MKRVNILSIAMLVAGAALAQTPRLLPQNPAPPPRTPIQPSTPGDFSPPGQAGRDELPPGRPFTTNLPPGRPFQDKTVPGRPFRDGASTNGQAGRPQTNASAAATNNVGGVGAGIRNGTGGLTNRSGGR